MSLIRQNTHPGKPGLSFNSGKQEQKPGTIPSGMLDGILKSNEELNNLQSVQNTISKYSDIIDRNPELSQARDSFNNLINNIIWKYYENRNSFIRSLKKVADALRNYGVMIENSELISISSVNESSLINTEAEAIVEKATVILETSKQLVDSLFYFGLNSETLLKLENSLESFSYASGLNKGNVFDVPDWKREIDKDYDEAYNFINEKLDGLIGALKDSYPKFYMDYLLSKMPVSTQSHS